MSEGAGQSLRDPPAPTPTWNAGRARGPSLFHSRALSSVDRATVIRTVTPGFESRRARFKNLSARQKSRCRKVLGRCGVSCAGGVWWRQVVSNPGWSSCSLPGEEVAATGEDLDAQFVRAAVGGRAEAALRRDDDSAHRAAP